MRSLSAAVFTLVAMVAMVIALPLNWTKSRVVDEDGYVAVATHAAQGTELQKAVAAELTNQGLALANAQGVPVPEVLVATLADTYTKSSGFPHDFGEANRYGHRWLFVRPGPGAPAVSVNSGAWQVDLAPLLKSLAHAGLPISVPDTLTYSVSDSGRTDLRPGRFADLGDQVNRWAPWSIAAAAIAGVLALLVSRRRMGVVAWLGVASLLAAGVQFLFLRFADSYISDDVNRGAPAAQRTGAALIVYAKSDGNRWALYAAGVGIALTGLGLIGVAVSGRRTR